MADETPKIPANDNPWYVLATFYGEQMGKRIWDIQEELHERNRQFWNCWMAVGLPKEEQNRLIEKGWVTEGGLNHVRKEELEKIWAGGRRPDLPPPNLGGDVNFESTEFPDLLSLKGMLFCAGTSFRNAEFQGNAFFVNAEFQGNCSFRGAEFQGNASFKDTEFQGDASFRDVEFQGNAFFIDAKFRSGAYFQYAGFQEDANFQDAEFQRNADFKGASKQEGRLKAREFAGEVSFAGAIFRKDSEFTNRKFLDKTYFNNARFLTEAPEFAGTTLHEGTTWHDVQWPQTPSDPEKARDMADAYSHLRRRSNEIQDHEAELDFFGRELRAKRAWKGGATGLLITLYEWSCGFGQSVHLPVFWLLGLWAGLPPVYHLVMQHAGMAGIDPVQLYGFSAASLGGFFGVRKEFFAADFMKDLPDAALALSGFQSVLGAVFLFLLGLSLRNRFRIR